MTTETRTTKCAKCKTHHQGFHVCVDLSYRVPGEARVVRRAPRVLARSENPPGDFNNWSDRGSRSW